MTWMDVIASVPITSSVPVRVRADVVKTLPIGLMDFVGEFTTQWPLMAAGMVVATVPMIVFYVVLQKRLMEAMTTGALRG